MNNLSIDFEHAMVSAVSRLSARGVVLPSDRRYFPVKLMSKYMADRLANAGLFAGASMMVCIGVLIKLAPAGVKLSDVWTHGLVALGLAQCAMLAGASFKVLTLLDEQKKKNAMHSYLDAEYEVARDDEIAATAARIAGPKMQPVAIASGSLGERTYIAFSDGSIEIDTMLGRRRFESLAAAREFVGA